jgi:hypothetical protein
MKARLALLLAALCGFYFWTVATSRRPIRLYRELGRQGERLYAGAYNVIAAGFLAGQLHLTIQPDPRLLALPDPYDASQNHPYRLHDASLYRGKYYYYWGPAPVLALFLPFRLLTGYYFPENLAGSLFASVSLLFSTASLIHLQRRWFPETPSWMVLLAVAGLGIANAAPFLLRRPAVYEVSLLAGWAFAAAAIYLLLRGSYGWAGVCLALAFATRPPYLFLSVLPVVLAWRQWRRLAAFFVPFTALLALHALYNFRRFDSPFEFGRNYCLTGSANMRRYASFDFARLAPGLRYFLFHPPRVSLDFPFFRTVLPAPAPVPDQYDPHAVTGLLPSTPFLAVLLWLPLLRPSPAFPFAAALLAGAVVILVAVVGVQPPAQIYQHYFLGLLLVPSCLVWFCWRSGLRRVLGGGLLLFSLLFHACNSLTGESDELRRFHPQTWTALRSVFAPLLRLSRSYGPLLVTLEFPPQPPGTMAPVVVTGDRAGADILFARYVGPDEIVFGLDHWGAPPVLSPPVRIIPHSTYRLEIHMGSLQPGSDTLLLKLDGREILRARSEFYTAHPSDVHVGRNPVGGSGGPLFPGHILEIRRLPLQ